MWFIMYVLSFQLSPAQSIDCCIWGLFASVQASGRLRLPRTATLASVQTDQRLNVISVAFLQDPDMGRQLLFQFRL